MEKRMNYKMLAGILLLLVILPARADSAIVDTDGDGVPDWEDYCPNTPPGKAVWTKEQLRALNLSPRFAGCIGGTVEAPVTGYEPPSRESVLARVEKERREAEAREAR